MSKGLSLLFLLLCAGATFAQKPQGICPIITYDQYIDTNTMQVVFVPLSDKADWVDVHYIINGGNQLNIRMTPVGTNHAAGINLVVGDTVRYFFTYCVRGSDCDTEMFTFTYQAPAPAPAPAPCVAAACAQQQYVQAPPPSYIAPAPTYIAPAPTYIAPAPTYVAPAQTYAAPTTSSAYLGNLNVVTVPTVSTVPVVDQLPAIVPPAHVRFVPQVSYQQVAIPAPQVITSGAVDVEPLHDLGPGLGGPGIGGPGIGGAAILGSPFGVGGIGGPIGGLGVGGLGVGGIGVGGIGVGGIGGPIGGLGVGGLGVGGIGVGGIGVGGIGGYGGGATTLPPVYADQGSVAAGGYGGQTVLPPIYTGGATTSAVVPATTGAITYASYSNGGCAACPQPQVTGCVCPAATNGGYGGTTTLPAIYTNGGGQAAAAALPTTAAITQYAGYANNNCAACQGVAATNCVCPPAQAGIQYSNVGSAFAGGVSGGAYGGQQTLPPIYTNGASSQYALPQQQAIQYGQIPGQLDTYGFPGGQAQATVPPTGV